MSFGRKKELTNRKKELTNFLDSTISATNDTANETKMHDIPSVIREHTQQSCYFDVLRSRVEEENKFSTLMHLITILLLTL